VHCANSNLLVLYIHEKRKITARFFSKSIVGAPFAKEVIANCSKNASSLANQTSNNKNKIVAHPADHGNACFGPTQQPTNNIAARV
jgi:hypothetical protein